MRELKSEARNSNVNALSTPAVTCVRTPGAAKRHAYGILQCLPKEYVRGDAYTNTVEGYFSILKRGIYGVYHHVSQEHLKRYLVEFDFRYNERIALGINDQERAAKAIKGAVGRRLTYRTTHRARA